MSQREPRRDGNGTRPSPLIPESRSAAWADMSPARVDNPLCRARNQTPEERVQRSRTGSIPHQGSMAQLSDDSDPESSGNLFRPGQFTGLARIELLPPKFVWIAGWPFGESGSCRVGM